MADKGINDSGLLYILGKIKANFALKSHTHSTSDVNSGNIVTGVKGNSESDYRTGQVNLTAANVGAAASSHTHGNIQNGGTLQTTDVDIASGDKLVITDSSDSSKVARTSLAFDGSTSTKALTKKGTWEDINYTMNAASANAAGTKGLVPAPAAGDQDKFLRGDGSWQAPTFSVPTASADTKGGVKIGAGLTMTGEVLSADVQSVPAMTGATASAAGTAGSVPAPAAGDQVKYLTGAGTWDTPAARHGSAVNGLSVEEGHVTTASGSSSHAEGHATTASGSSSHAEGGNTTASNSYSHAEGFYSEASGSYSHAEGTNATASGTAAHAEGTYSTASGKSSHAEGTSTIANHKSQHVFGEFNIADDSSAIATERGNYVEIVGNGTASDAKSNARTLDWSGNEVLSGTLTTGGDITVPSGSKYNGSGAGLTNIPASAVPVMTGATSSADGTSGVVPAPSSSNRNKFLRGDATWATPDDSKVQINRDTYSDEKVILFSTPNKSGLSDANNTTWYSPTSTASYNENIYIKPSAGEIHATKFVGSGAGLTNIPASALPDLSSTYALKTDISSMYRHKGTVADLTALNALTGMAAGDVYNVTATGMNYVYVDSTTGWDALGSLYEPAWLSNNEIDAVFTSANLTAT